MANSLKFRCPLRETEAVGISWNKKTIVLWNGDSKLPSSLRVDYESMRPCRELKPDVQ